MRQCPKIPKKKGNRLRARDEKNGGTDYIIGTRSPTGVADDARTLAARSNPWAQRMMRADPPRLISVREVLIWGNLIGIGIRQGTLEASPPCHYHTVFIQITLPLPLATEVTIVLDILYFLL